MSGTGKTKSFYVYKNKKKYKIKKIEKIKKTVDEEKTDTFCQKILENILVNLAFSGKKR